MNYLVTVAFALLNPEPNLEPEHEPRSENEEA
jgi:hypothetical protein